MNESQTLHQQRVLSAPQSSAQTNYNANISQIGKTQNIAQENLVNQTPMAQELDEKSMTLMDISDNAYYDVDKHKFMKIATSSTKYPKHITVQPIDQKAIELLNKRNMLMR